MLVAIKYQLVYSTNMWGGSGDLEAACRRRGLPVTAQRRIVLEILRGRRDHPSADQLYDEVRARLPAISRTTVYRVLETLVRLGLARKVSQPGAAARFDARVERHHHVTCLRCGRIADYDDRRLDALRLPARTGFRISDYSVHFTGVCEECRGKKRSKA